MKNGTQYAARLKKAYAAQRAAAPKREIPKPDDPVRRLAVAIMGMDCTIEEAEQRVDHVLKTAVDWNEVRVSLPSEVCALSGQSTTDGGLERCQRLVSALRAIYQKEHCVSLERLRDLGRREARQYLDQLNGVDEHAAASVVLWSLGGHAIPVNDPLLRALREADLVSATATRAEVQAFLERHVTAAQAKEFCLAMQSFKPKAGGARAKPAAESKKPAKAKKAASG